MVSQVSEHTVVPTHLFSHAYMQNSRTLRRLAADHSALHNQPLPPNFLFAPEISSSDDLTQLDILLAGPTHTPFAAGVFALHLTIPPTYPQQPPTAHFRTPIFHPNVDQQTGGVCVETLKRDWDAKLTLRDILVVIGCLLIQPNPDSALNAEAGGLIQEDYAAFTRRAVLMTSIHAGVGKTLKAAVEEAQNRGQETASEQDVHIERRDFAEEPAAPARRRRLGMSARQRGTAASRRSRGSPSDRAARSREHADEDHTSSLPSNNDSARTSSIRDVSPPAYQRKSDLGDDSMTDADQENDSTKCPKKTHSPMATTPRRPAGVSVPLGELTMDEAPSPSSLEGELEYPPSPKKIPRKPRELEKGSEDRPESSRDGAARGAPPNITPPTSPISKPLAPNSPFFNTSGSPRKTLLQRPATPPARPGSSGKGSFGFAGTPQNERGVFKQRSPSSEEKKRAEEVSKRQLSKKLWRLCGGDIDRWNRGDFDGEPFEVRAGRW